MNTRLSNPDEAASWPEFSDRQLQEEIASRILREILHASELAVADALSHGCEQGSPEATRAAIRAGYHVFYRLHPDSAVTPEQDVLPAASSTSHQTSPQAATSGGYVEASQLIDPDLRVGN